MRTTPRRIERVYVPVGLLERGNRDTQMGKDNPPKTTGKPAPKTAGDTTTVNATKTAGDTTTVNAPPVATDPGDVGQAVDGSARGGMHRSLVVVVALSIILFGLV